MADNQTLALESGFCSSVMVFHIDPLNDDRWPEFVDRHPKSSVFHTREWLRALSLTYGYRAIVLTTSTPHEDLANGIACCEVNSWLTGRRLVSLPFSDHCEPLVQSSDDLQLLVPELKNHQPRRWKYVELRPRSDWSGDFGTRAGFALGSRYFLHTLDLRPSVSELHRGFHEDSIRRKIRRAEREGLMYEEGRSEAMLADFYRLLLMTRRRHQLPPQPVAWFRNLISLFGDRLKIRTVSKNDRTIASILTLRHKRTLVYKYGCSDARYHNLGGMPLLFWKTIQDAKSSGAEELDLGRSETSNEGLISFKEHLGAVGSKLVYLRYPATEAKSGRGTWKMRFLQETFSHLPGSLQAVAGKALYRHVG